MRNYFLFLLLSLSTSTSAQKFVQDFLSMEDGLSQSTVEAITQDTNGFLWVGTSFGLNQYDGNVFKVYHNIPYDTSSLSCSKINHLTTDRHNQIWIGNCRGLEVFNNESKRFQSFYLETQQGEPLENPLTYFIYEDPKGQIWISNSRGIWRYEGGLLEENQAVNRSRVRKMMDVETVGSAGILLMHMDQQGLLWVATFGTGLYCFAPTEDGLQLKAHFLTNSYSKDYPNIAVYSLLEEPGHQLVIGASNGIFIYNYQDEMLKPFEEWGYKAAYAIHKITDDQFIVGSRTGLYQVDRSPTGSTIRDDLFEDPSFKDINKQLSIKAIWQDQINPDLFWVATSNRGVLKMERRANNFSPIRLDRNKTNSNVNYLAHYDNKTWLDLADILLVHDAEKDSFQTLDFIQTQEEIIPANALHHLFVDKEGKLWSGTWAGDLLDLSNCKGGQQVGEMFSKEESEQFFLSFYEEQDWLCIGGYSGDIFFFNKRKRAFEELSLKMEASVKDYFHPVTAMLKDKQSNFWVGTWQGLFLYPSIGDSLLLELKQQPILHLHVHQDLNSIPNHEIQCLVEDNQGNIWAGTSYGLTKIAMTDGQVHFKNFTTEDGLGNNHVSSILIDSMSGHLWLGTRGGLSRFDPENGQFNNFYTKDGLQGEEFNIGSAAFAADGSMLFGGTNGYNRFKPRDISIKKSNIPIRLTELVTRDGETYNLLNANEIELPVRQNSFSIHFVGLNFKQLDGIQYTYELDGNDNYKASINNSQQVNFYRLPPGRYQFKIALKESMRISGTSEDQLTIVIPAPFWQRPFFWIIASLGLLGIITFIQNWRYRQKLNQIRIAEGIRKNAAEDFHDELGSKLTVITLNSRMLESELVESQSQVQGYLQKITQTSSTLIDSMRDLLWTLNPDKDSIADLYDHLKEFGEQLFEYSDIEFHTSGLTKNLYKQKLSIESQRHILLIFKESMHNSLRHSGAENIYFEIGKQEHQLYCQLKDDGHGFSIKNHHKGYGLASIQKRAQKIQAELRIDSTESGTTTTLQFPL